MLPKNSVQTYPKTRRIDYSPHVLLKVFNSAVAWRQQIGAGNMASWIEIERVRKDPNLFKPLAGHLLADLDYAQVRSDTATDFLESVSRYRSDEISIRQGDFLLELRDEAKVYLKLATV